MLALADKPIHLVVDQPNGLYDIAKDFVLPLFLTLLAALAAYYIFYRETRRDKEKEEVARQQKIKDKLTYFTALLSNIIKTATDQHQYLLEWIENVNKDDVNFHLLTYMPIQDLERLVKIDVESYLLSYAEFYSQNRKESIKTFKKMMVNVDYQYQLFNSIFSQLQKGQQFDFERKKQYQELFYKAYNLGGVIIQQLNEQPDWLKRFLELAKDFDENHPGDNYDITFYHKYYFEPFNQFFADHMGIGFLPSLELSEAAIASRDGKQLFQHIKVENQQLAKDFSIDAERMKESIEDLKSLSTQLITDFAD